MANVKPWFDTARIHLIGYSLQTFLLGGAVLCAFIARFKFGCDLLAAVLVGYSVFFLLSLAVYRVVLAMHPLRPGTYEIGSNQTTYFVWQLQASICIFNLWPVLMGGLVPPPLRVHMFRLCGLHVGRGRIIIGGNIFEPTLVHIGGNNVIGSDSLITPHLINSHNVLMLGDIYIGRGVIIGPGSQILPGVTIEENAIVTPGSIVLMGTRIGRNEVWSGNPAKKIGMMD